MTGGSIINAALADLGVIRPGETVSPTVSADCLLRLNMLLSSLSIEELMAQFRQHGIFNLQAGNARYTLGVGGSFGTISRPEKVTGWRASYGGFSSGGRILTFEELQQASVDGLGTATTLPQAVGADTNFPLLNVGVFPIPGSNPGTLELSYFTALQSFNDLVTVYTFPDGWDELLHFNLAMALLPRYGRQNFQPEVLAADAQNAKAKVADLNRSAQAPSK